MSRQILYIWMVQGQEQRGWQRQGGRGSATEGQSPESSLWQKGEIQAGNLQSKGQDLDHLWPGTKAPKSEVGRFWWMGTAHPQQKWAWCWLWGLLSHFSSRKSHVLRARLVHSSDDHIEETGVTGFALSRGKSRQPCNSCVPGGKCTPEIPKCHLKYYIPQETFRLKKKNRSLSIF